MPAGVGDQAGHDLAPRLVAGADEKRVAPVLTGWRSNEVTVFRKGSRRSSDVVGRAGLEPATGRL